MTPEQIKTEVEKIVTDSITKFSSSKFGDGTNLKTILVPDMVKYITELLSRSETKEKAPKNEIKE